MFYFILTETGYSVFLNGELQVRCEVTTEHQSGAPFVSDEAKRAHAKESFPDATEL